jgi:acyl carrier protein
MNPGSQDTELKQALKRLIVAACNKDIPPESIADDATLVGFGSELGLDSLDVLQINVALTREYGVRIQDSKHARRVMKTVNSLADFIRPGG